MSNRRDCLDVRFVASISIPRREHVAEILHFGSSGWENMPVSCRRGESSISCRTIRLSLRGLHRNKWAGEAYRAQVMDALLNLEESSVRLAVFA